MTDIHMEGIMQQIEINLDHTPVGCGTRFVLVLTTGPKWVTVFYPAACLSWKVEREKFDRLPKVPHDYPPARIARQIRARLALSERYGFRTSGNDALLALAALEHPAAG